MDNFLNLNKEDEGDKYIFIDKNLLSSFEGSYDKKEVVMTSRVANFSNLISSIIDTLLEKNPDVLTDRLDVCSDPLENGTHNVWMKPINPEVPVPVIIMDLSDLNVSGLSQNPS